MGKINWARVILGGLVPGFQMEGRGAEPYRPQPAMRGAHQISQLPPHQPPLALRMLPHHQLVPGPHLLALLRIHQKQLQIPDLAHLCGDFLWLGHRLGVPSQPPVLHNV